MIPRHCFSYGVAISLLTAAALVARPAHAQQVVIAAAADIGDGSEGGGSGYAKGIRRSRTTLRVGAQGYINESPENVVAAAALVELEPTASIGAEVSYVRMVEDIVAFNLGATAVIAPKHMVGVTFGIAFKIPLSDSVSLSIGPRGNVYFFGADLPGSQVLWQAIGQAGVRVGF